MIIFRDLKELLEIVITWEKKLTDFYEAAELVIEEKKCREMLSLLSDNHEKNLQILKNIHIEDYGKDEWIQWAPEFDIKHLLPITELTKQSTKEEIARSILEFEEKMKRFYSTISEKIITAEEKELFESLATFKDRQIFEIKKSMEIY